MRLYGSRRYDRREPYVVLTCGHYESYPCHKKEHGRCLWFCSSCDDGPFPALPKTKYGKALPDEPEF